ncbi:hypothetical protein C8Q78DRAFT_1082082 [Trametes maxima]|nr:hypothetical protein C8Q78DRAFT_1082082 [Trametes maxima]
MHVRQNPTLQTPPTPFIPFILRKLPLEIQQEILKQTYGSHLADLDDIERDEEHQANLHQLMWCGRFPCPPPSGVTAAPNHLAHPVPERLQQFFKDVCTFETQFCRCHLSDATSDRPHYNFCQVLGMEAVELEEIDNNETLARIARTATPYMTHFRMLSVPLEQQSRGLHLLQCHWWWGVECPIEFVSMMDNMTIEALFNDPWKYLPPYPLRHPSSAHLFLAFFENLHTICISTPTHVARLTHDVINFYLHPPDANRGTLLNHDVWQELMPQPHDNDRWIKLERQMVKGWFEGVPSLRRVVLEHRRQEPCSTLGLQNAFPLQRAAEHGRKSLFVMCEDGLVRWQSAYVNHNLDRYRQDNLQLASNHEINPFTGQLLPLYPDDIYQLLEERTPSDGPANPSMKHSSYVPLRNSSAHRWIVKRT